MRNRLGVMLGCTVAMSLLVVGDVWAANATWSEEWNAFPNTATGGHVWGAFDDAGGGTGGVWSRDDGKTEVLASGPNGATGVFRVKPGEYSGGDTGMVVVDPGTDGDPLTGDNNLSASPITTPKWTYEVRYRINTTFAVPLEGGDPEAIQWPSPSSPTGKMSPFPLMFMASPRGTVGPGFRFAVGYINVDSNDNEIEAYYTTHMNEGIPSWGGVQSHIPASVAGAPAMDTWQVLRVTSTYDPAGGGTGEYVVHLNGNQVHTFDLTGKGPPPVDYSRSVGVQRQEGGNSQQGNPDPKWTMNDYVGQEVMIDYMRLVDRAIPFTEALNAASTGCAGNLNGDGTTDGADVAIIYNAWGTNNAVADIDDSGTVDGADLAQVFNCWGQADTAGVPEPASLGILGMGLIGLLAARRRA